MPSYNSLFGAQKNSVAVLDQYRTHGTPPRKRSRCFPFIPQGDDFPSRRKFIKLSVEQDRLYGLIIPQAPPSYLKSRPIPGQTSNSAFFREIHIHSLQAHSDRNRPFPASFRAFQGRIFRPTASQGVHHLLNRGCRGQIIAFPGSRFPYLPACFIRERIVPPLRQLVITSTGIFLPVMRLRPVISAAGRFPEPKPPMTRPFSSGKEAMLSSTERLLPELMGR